MVEFSRKCQSLESAAFSYKEGSHQTIGKASPSNPSQHTCCLLFEFSRQANHCWEPHFEFAPPNSSHRLYYCLADGVEGETVHTYHVCTSLGAFEKIVCGGIVPGFSEGWNICSKNGGLFVCVGEFVPAISKRKSSWKNGGVLILIPVTRIFWVVSPSEFLVITGNMFSSIPTKVFIWNPGILGFGR